MDVTEIRTQRDKERSWLYLRWGRKEFYKKPQESLLDLLEDHAGHVERETIGRVYQELKAREPKSPIAGFRRAVDVVYELLTKAQPTRVA